MSATAAGQPDPVAPGAALKASDVAALLAVNVRKVWAWINAGRLAAVNVTPGGDRPTWRVDPADYRAFRDGLLNVKPPRQARRRPACDEVHEYIK